MATTSPSIKLIRASDGSGNASAATVQNTRSPGATTIQVDTVQGIPDNFYASMGTPHTFTDPVTGETITVISEASAVDFEGHVDGSNLEIDAIAAGYTDGGSAVGDIVIIRPTTPYANNVADVLDVSHNDDGTFKDDSISDADMFTDPLNPVIRDDEITNDFISSGGVITGDSYGANRNASMTALVAYINGQRGTIAAVNARTYTASKDTYVDVLNTAGVFTLVYTEVANGAASPALAANSIRLGKVVTGASSIAAASSITQIGIDSLNNVIYPNGSVGGAELNNSELGFLNTRIQYNTSAINPGGTSVGHYGAQGLQISVTVPERCRAVVEVFIAASSTTDFEFRPRIYTNGNSGRELQPVAAPGFAGNRATQRTVKDVITLEPGTTLIQGGCNFSSGTSISIPIGAAFVFVQVLGKVTA